MTQSLPPIRALILDVDGTLVGADFEVSPRVRIVRRPNSLYSAEKKLGEALEAAKIDFIWAN